MEFTSQWYFAMITLLSDGQMIPCDDHTMCVRTVEERNWLGFCSAQVGCNCCFKSYTIIHIIYYMFYVNVWFNFFFSNSLSLQAFNNIGQEVVSTKDRPELEDRGITGMYSQLFVSHGQDSWYWIFRKISCLETMRCTTQMLHGKEMGEKLQVILMAQV